ncbi:hypothetical protein [Parasphingorhabdus sp.]|uniref:hypothetical protein n=1 Tax=Parasphingorhabdus sp. TaxID=2709688 RepID=UPI0032EA928A
MTTTQFLSEAPLVPLSTTQWWISHVLLASLALLSLCYCIFVAFRRRQAFPLYILAGSQLVIFYEIFVDVLGRCQWADEWGFVSAMGRDLPLIANLVYMFYFPVAITAVNLSLERGFSVREWWRWAVLGIPLAILFELYPVNNGWWFYYGEGQPLTIMNYPIWWAFPACLATLGTGAVIFIVRRYVLRGNDWCTIVLFPCILIGLHMSMAFPAFITLPTSTELRFTVPAAAATITISLLVYGIIGTLLSRIVPLPGRIERTDLSQ